MISVGGLPVEVRPSVALSPDERSLLETINRLAVPTITERTVVLSVVEQPPWPAPKAQRSPFGLPAAIDFDGDLVRVAHADLIGAFDVATGCGSYARFTNSSAPLRIMLRTVFAASLPLRGGIPLHAAAVVHDDYAYLFFGESGAGKTTIASIAGLPILSDEIVAVSLERGVVLARTAGLGDELGSSGASGAPVRVRALVQLGKGDHFAVTELAPAEALPQLIKVILSPAHPRVWAGALRVVGDILNTCLPVLRMEWSPSESPLPALEEWLSRRRAFPA